MPSWTYYSSLPVQIDSQNENAVIHNNIINGSAIQIQYTDLQQFESTGSVTTLPVIQTNADGEDVYHAGLEAQDFYIPSTATMISDVGVEVGGSIFNGPNSIAVCTPVQNLPSVTSESALTLVTPGATFLPQETLMTGNFKISCLIN